MWTPMIEGLNNENGRWNEVKETVLKYAQENEMKVAYCDKEIGLIPKNIIGKIIWFKM